MLKTKFKLSILCLLITVSTFYVSFFILVPQALADADYVPTDIRESIVVPFGDYSNLGEVSLEACPTGDASCWRIPWLAKYIGNMYRYGVVIGAVLATMMIMIGGMMYLSAGLNPQLASRGKEFIIGAVTGLVLLLGSYVLLNTINPNLTSLKPIMVEIAKEAKVGDVLFCNELPAGEYVLTGDPACGKTMTYKAKDPKVTHEGECLGDECPDPKKCVPVDPSSDEEYTCKEIVVWGTISDYEERYLDEIVLYSAQGKDLTNIYSESKWDKGHKSYYIAKSDLSSSAISKLQSISDVVIGIELNDEGYEKQKLAYGKSAAGILKHVTPTADDDYYVGRYSSDKSASHTYTGVWISADCTQCVTITPKTPGKKGGDAGWLYKSDCGYFNAYNVLNGGIRVDINADNFWEDTTADCDLIDDVIAEGGPKKGVGESCGANSQCASGDCESEGGIQKCECNENADCDAGALCKTSLATWNICVSGKLVGDSCTEDSNCISDRCEAHLCRCSVNQDCQAGQLCNSSTNLCESGKDVGEICTSDDECVSDDCESEPGWYGVGATEKRCECSSDNDCGKNKKCVEVESGCGWNYCVPAYVPSVPENFNPNNFPSDPPNKGLCDEDAICISSECNIDWGINDCNACE
jgi:hypothetical protein